MSFGASDDRKRPANRGVGTGSPVPKRSRERTDGNAFHTEPLVPDGVDPGKRWLRYNDEIHRSIDLCPLMAKVMDTWPVQRLRDLRQLGTAHYVYACATHTRFDHSVGVAHLALHMCRRLKERYPTYGATSKDVLCVALAGLLHDTGHGPFSHLYESFRKEVNSELEQNPEKRKLYSQFPEVPTVWDHENSSLMMVDEVLKCFGLEIDLRPEYLDKPLKQIGDGIDAETVRCYWNDSPASEQDLSQVLTNRDWIFIKECITGEPLPEVVEHLGINRRVGREDPKLEWLYDIVCNKPNKMDVDKVDYFARDARRTLNGSGNIDIAIINEACVARADCKNAANCEKCKSGQYHYQICYPEKCAERLIDFFRNRGKYHEYIYQHKTSVAASYMVSDILKEADLHFLLPTSTGSKLPLSRAFYDPHSFERLRDSIIDQIAYSDSPELKTARDLALRYKRRDLYKICKEEKIHMDNPIHKELWDRVEATPNEVVREIISQNPQHDGNDGVLIELKENDVIIKCGKWDQGHKDRNPLEFLRFVDKSTPSFAIDGSFGDEQLARKVDEKDYGMHLSRQFSKRVIRVYTRDPTKRDLIAHAFEQYWESHIKSAPVASAYPPKHYELEHAAASDASYTDESLAGGHALNVNKLTQESDDEDEPHTLAAKPKSGGLPVASPSPA